MTYTDNSFSLQERADAQEAFSLWQGEIHESVDQYTLRKRKAELYALVRRVVKNELDPLQQKIVRLHWYEGKTLSEVALILGMEKTKVSRNEKKINEIIYDKLKYAIEYRFGRDFSDKATLIIGTGPSACCPVEGASISERLRNLRLRQCLSTEELATVTGISKGRLNFIEKEGGQTTAEEISRLAALFGTTSDYILFGKTQINKHGEGVVQ